MTVSVHLSDCVAWLVDYAAAHVRDPDAHPLFDSCATDPPYHLTSIVRRFGGDGAAPAKKGRAANATGAYARASKGFMGKTWDGGDVAFRPETWRAVYDVLKPGAHLVAFSGTRTYHRMACAIEDAGFEIRDCLFWCYGSGFPKSHDVAKGIDKAAGHWRGKAGAAVEGDARRAFGQHYARSEKGEPITAAAAAWHGWGTALKPALEPICLARKPLSEKSVAANVLKHGTGALNIDACRVGAEKLTGWGGAAAGGGTWNDDNSGLCKDGAARPVLGRWPANLVHDGSEDVVGIFPETQSGKMPAGTIRANRSGFTGNMPTMTANDTPGDSGCAARFFYSAKAGPLDRIGTAHATVKPVDLMRWLVRLITQPGGHLLDPFAGSGTTGLAAMAEGFDATLIEMEADHVADINRKLAWARGDGALSMIEHLRRDVAAAGGAELSGGLFDFDWAGMPENGKAA